MLRDFGGPTPGEKVNYKSLLGRRRDFFLTSIVLWLNLTFFIHHCRGLCSLPYKVLVVASF